MEINKMAHYDCSDCGESMGIAWGYCGACTPPEYLELKTHCNDLYDEADEGFENYIETQREKWIKQELAKTDYNASQKRMKALEQAHNKQEKKRLDKIYGR